MQKQNCDNFYPDVVVVVVVVVARISLRYVDLNYDFIAVWKINIMNQKLNFMTLQRVFTALFYAT